MGKRIGSGLAPPPNQKNLRKTKKNKETKQSTPKTIEKPIKKQKKTKDFNVVIGASWHRGLEVLR